MLNKKGRLLTSNEGKNFSIVVDDDLEVIRD